VSDKKRRRGKNEGSIRYIESKKLYEGRYTIGRDENGKRISKSIYGKKRQDVVKKMRDALTALGKGEYIDPSDKPLYAWCKEWYEVYKEPTLKKDNTKNKYSYSLKRLQRYEVAYVPLEDLSLETMQRFYNKMAEDYSESTIRITHALINGALKKAKELKMIFSSPAEDVVIPVDDEYENEGPVKALTDKEYDSFFDLLGSRSHYFMIGLFMANTGLRPGEAVACNRSDLIRKRKRIKVTKTYIAEQKQVQYSPKTKSSRREVPVPDKIMKLMDEYMFKQPNKKPNDPLFQSLNGTRISPRNLARQFKKIGEAIGCDWITPHTMRHTYASRMFKKGIDIKIISSILGHKKISTTYDIYVHFIDNIKEDSVQLLNEGLPEMLPQKEIYKKDNVTKLKA
jgi:integrase